MKTTPNIVHIMADGTVKDSVQGVVIQDKQFYIVYNEILKKVGAKNVVHK